LEYNILYRGIKDKALVPTPTATEYIFGITHSWLGQVLNNKYIILFKLFKLFYHRRVTQNYKI